MKKTKLTFGIALTGLLTCLLSGCGGGKDVIIYVDGGGDNGNYNTTMTMVKTESNPYPYNTLQTVCDEWSAAHPGYKVKVNRVSANGDRSVLLPQLKQGTAPHIVYQNGTVVNSDLGTDYYVDLTDYLDTVNPYLDGNKNWRTVYDEDELASTAASNGHFYYVNMEKVPVCLIANKTLLSKAGVTDVDSITTFSKLLEAMQKVEDYATAQGNDLIKAYSTSYTWYQIAMESNMFADLLPQGDVLLPNRSIDTEEFCRLYTKGIWKPDLGVSSYVENGETHYKLADGTHNRYFEYLKVIQALNKFKVTGGYDRDSNFINGNLAFVEATGKVLRTYSGNSHINFDWITIPFPDVTTEDSPDAKTPCVRGSAGLATSYWVSKAAVKDNCVDACIDLLMFLTSPEINNRFVGDLKGGMPLNPDPSYEAPSYIKPLFEKYKADKLEGERVAFNSFASRDKLGVEFGNLFIRTMEEVDAGIRSLVDALGVISLQIRNTVRGYIADFEYDDSKW